MTWSDIPGDDPTNAAMIKRDELPTAPAKPQEDDRQAVLDAIETLRDECIQCAIDECASPGPSGHKCDPDYSRADVAEGVLLKAIDDLLARRLAQAMPAPTPTVEKINTGVDGLTVEHVPGDRWSVR